MPIVQIAFQAPLVFSGPLPSDVTSCAEPPYIRAGPFRSTFIVLLWFGLLAGFPLPRWQGRYIALLMTLGLVLTSFFHATWRQAHTGAGGSQYNEDFEAPNN